MRLISRPSDRSFQIVPQQYTAPATVRAQVRPSPALTYATDAGIAGRDVPVTNEPLPSWPRSFPPQHDRTPSVRMAQVCVTPALICAQGRLPETRAGVGPPAAKSLSCPWSFAPQQYASRDCVMAQVCLPPALIEMSFTPARTGCGVAVHG